MSDYFSDNQPDAKLGRKSLRGGAILIVARAVNVFLQISTTFILARLVTPHDYGLVAMVSALVGFAPMLIELGTTDAAVQKDRITEVEVSALFWLNLSLGAGLAFLLAVASPLIARFYGEPELQKIALVSSVTFLFSALSCQHYALLRRAMKFKNVALIDVVSNLLSTVVAIAMALFGCGYWALVAKPILSTVFAACGVWWSCRWLPGRPRLTPGVKEMLGFGVNVTGFTMTDYVGRSMDRVALGYRFGASQLGYFQNAMYVYESLLGLLTQPLHSVAVSSLTKLRQDIIELKKAWASALSSLCFFAMPAFAILAVTSQDVVRVFLGPKWEAAGPLLGLFALRGIAHVVERTLGWLHVAAGRSDRWMRWGILSSATQLGALGCGLPFGTKGVAIAYAVAMFVLFLPALSYAGRPLGIGSAMILKVVGPLMVAALSSAVLGYWVRQLVFAEISGLARICFLSVLCGLTYLVITIGCFRITKPLRVAFSLLREYIPTSFCRIAIKPGTPI
jgi:polysaccharide transporter, PST family